MEYTKLILSEYGTYSCREFSNDDIGTLGFFLSSDISFRIGLFRPWAIDDSLGMETSGNTTRLEKENNYIFLSDLYDEDNPPSTLKISREQFVKILDEWDKKIIKADPRPKEVIIKQDGDLFFIETNN